jgi:hypothetical protein
MKVFLAATSSREAMGDELLEIPYLLESFYSLQNEKTLKRIIKHNKENFLLDSGAFTFMSGTGKADFDEYLTKYINFINKYNIKYFFELDVDSVVGYDKVKEYRKRLEKETGKKCIPVWHKSRGKDEFLKMCDEYDYVAIGGIVTKEITKDQYPFFTWFLSEAHKRDCKVHGLGFTATKELHKYHFDTVDSTNWLSGGRFGQLHTFNGRYIESKSYKKKRAVYKAIDSHNLKEWVKFQRYAEKKL